MNRLRMTLAGALLVAVAAAPLLAQSKAASKYQLEGGLLYATLSGNDFQGTDAGFGFDVQGRMNLSGPWSLGVAVHRTSHNVSAAGASEGVLGFGVEPRYAFKASGSMTPYAFARASYLKGSLSSGGTDFSSNGHLVGLGGGILWTITPTINFDGAVGYNLIGFGDIDAGGTTIPSSDTSGSSLNIRFGIMWAVGSK
jgi:hypothetical protein